MRGRYDLPDAPCSASTPRQLAVLGFAMFAVPSICGLRLVVNFAIDSYFCFPSELRRDVLPGSAWPTLLGLDLLGIVIAAFAALISYRNWRLTRDELEVPTAPLIELGEGRTRFLSLWGLLIGFGFTVAIAFDLVGLWIVPVCG